MDGTLTAASYSELEAVCSNHRATSAVVTIFLDLGGIVFMNDEIAKKLASLRSEQLKIINCSPFIEALLETTEE